MIKTLLELFIIEKDSRGFSVTDVINSLSLRTHTPLHNWSYLKEEDVYENTVDGTRLFSYEIHKK